MVLIFSMTVLLECLTVLLEYPDLLEIFSWVDINPSLTADLHILHYFQYPDIHSLNTNFSIIRAFIVLSIIIIIIIITFYSKSDNETHYIILNSMTEPQLNCFFAMPWY